MGDDFYNWLAQNNITFFNDPSLESLSSGLVLESNSITTGNLIGDNNSISQFSSTITDNILWQNGSTLSLGSNFGSKPSITLATPSFLSDLSNTVSIKITATVFKYSRLKRK